MAIEMIEEFEQGTRIKVMGVGGGGGNAVEHMISRARAGRGGHLRQHRCAGPEPQQRAQRDPARPLGPGRGRQTGGRQAAAAEEAMDRIREAIDGAHMLFLTAGMGGGTGTGAAPVIARIAKEMGILTVGVVTKPFEFEGNRRMKAAEIGVAELEANVDSLIVVLNEKLLEVLGDDVTQEGAFAHANDVLTNAVGGISDVIHVPGLVNVDFEDVKTVMSEPGKAMMGTAQAGGPDRATKAAEHGRGLPAARRHRPLGRARRAGADRGGEGQLQVVREPQRDEHDPPLRRRRRACDLRHRVRRRRSATSCASRSSPPACRRRAAAQSTPIQVVHSAPHAAHRHRQPADHERMSQQPQQCRSTAAARHRQDYSQLATPSVWRNARTQAAAKVDALASNGMDEIEIPAFLRKQAD